jgi:hypothetical protein
MEDCFLGRFVLQREFLAENEKGSTFCSRMERARYLTQEVGIRY